MHLHFYIFTHPYIHIHPQSYIHTSLHLYIYIHFYRNRSTFIRSYFIFIPLYIHTSLQHLYAHTSLHPCIHMHTCFNTLLHSYTFVHSYIYALIYSYIPTFTHSFICTLYICIHPYTDTLIRTPHIHTLFHAFQQSCINIFTLLFEYMKYEWVNVWL